MEPSIKPLDVLIKGFLPRFEQPIDKTQLNELHKFLRGLRVELVHIPKEKNKHFPRIKIITGLASKCDRLSKAHPPIVKDNGAGPNDIQFNLLDRTADGSMPELDDPTAPGHYVTVAKYFRDRKSRILHLHIDLADLK